MGQRYSLDLHFLGGERFNALAACRYQRMVAVGYSCRAWVLTFLPTSIDLGLIAGTTLMGDSSGLSPSLASVGSLRTFTNDVFQITYTNILGRCSGAALPLRKDQSRRTGEGL